MAGCPIQGLATSEFIPHLVDTDVDPVGIIGEIDNGTTHVLQISDRTGIGGFPDGQVVVALRILAQPLAGIGIVGTVTVVIGETVRGTGFSVAGDDQPRYGRGQRSAVRFTRSRGRRNDEDTNFSIVIHIEGLEPDPVGLGAVHRYPVRRRIVRTNEGIVDEKDLVGRIGCLKNTAHIARIERDQAFRTVHHILIDDRVDVVLLSQGRRPGWILCLELLDIPRVPGQRLGIVIFLDVRGYQDSLRVGGEQISVRGTEIGETIGSLVRIEVQGDQARIIDILVPVHTGFTPA